jgi:hypothetical protein
MSFGAGSNTEHALKTWVKHANHWGHAPKCSHQSWAVTWFGQLEPWVLVPVFGYGFWNHNLNFFKNKFGEKWFGTGGWLAINCYRTGTGTEFDFQNLNLILFFQELDPGFPFFFFFVESELVSIFIFLGWWELIRVSKNLIFSNSHLVLK